VCGLGATNRMMAVTGTWSITAADGTLSTATNWSAGGPIGTVGGNGGASDTDTLTFGTQTTGATTLAQTESDFASNLLFGSGASNYIWNSANFNLNIGHSTTSGTNTPGSIANNAGVQIFNLGTGI